MHSIYALEIQWNYEKNLDELPFLETVGEIVGLVSKAIEFGRATARKIELHTTIFLISNPFEYSFFTYFSTLTDWELSEKSIGHIDDERKEYPISMLSIR